MAERPPTPETKRIAPGTAAKLPSSAPAAVDAPGRTGDLLQAAPKLELPKGGGALRGIGETFKANPVTGSASVSVPLSISPGRNGFTPALTLSYDSGSGNGVFGVGWALSTGMVQRKTDQRLPTYTDEDVFVLSESEDLVPVGEPRTVTESSVAYAVQRYRPRVEAANAKIERWTDADGVAHWRTWDTKNVRRTYGFWAAANSRLGNPAVPTKVYSWYLDEERDEVGNIIRYLYDTEATDAASGLMADQGRTYAARYLKRVRYANAVPGSISAADGWYLEVVFDYGDHTASPPTLAPDAAAAPVRQDPYSRFKAGFDIRCARLCRRVLVFHRFPSGADGDAVLTRLTTFTYDENPVATTLASVTHVGLDPAWDAVAMPPVSFTYVAPSQSSAPSLLRGLDDLPAGVDFSRAQWVDLDGEGLTGLLTETGGAWWYSRNEGEGALSSLRRLPSRPSPALGAGQLVDVDGDGRLELLVRGPGMYGYFGRTAEDGWSAYRPLPNRPLPEGRTLDLDGDGLPDVLVPGPTGLLVYRSRGADGWSAPAQTERPTHEDRGPVALYQTDRDAVFLADMVGDGLLDVVRVRNGSVCYWPNLGYGRFGGRVQLSGAPLFDRPERFDPKRVRLVDIDGSGPADLVYLGPNRVRWWASQAGNGFGPERVVAGVPGVEDPVTVSFADIRGDGTSCLVWASPLRRDGIAPIRYARLMQDGKPYLLRTLANNLGRTVTFTYTPSTSFYVADRRSGSPWATRLPFPVQCLSAVEVVDGVTGWRFVTTYSYHHGYYDGVEREFRGFGRVDQRDAESLDDSAFAQPPVLSRSWFHTGAWKEEGTLETAFAAEWWTGDAVLPGPTAMPTESLTPERVRESFRALKGRPLRVEVYAEDGSELEDVPYTVTTSRYSVVALEDGVFRVDARETVTEHVERGSDTRVAHELVLEVGPFGEVTRQAQVAYGRSTGDAAQTTPVVLVSSASFVHDTDSDSRWHVAVPSRTQRHHLGGIDAPTPAAPATITGINTLFEGATAIDWDEAPPGTGAWARLVADERISYEDALADEVFPGATWTLGDRALVYQAYRRAFTDSALAASEAFDGLITSTELEDAGYVAFGAPETGWWAPSGTLTRDASHFYLPTAYTDPFGNATSVSYDDAYLAPVEVTDALGNVTTVTFDTHYLQPSAVTDPNGNGAEVAFDALGRVIALAQLGAASEGDTLSDPTETFTYELDRWVSEAEPARVHHKRREAHGGTATWLERYDYSDGSGNVVHSKVEAAPDPVTSDPRWIGTGHIVLDNKGNVVKQYEPFYEDNADYEFESELAMSGVASTVTYDPLGRAIRVDLPNGTRRRVSFDPWTTTTWDENDCSSDEDLTADPDLLARAADHAETPAVVRLDVQGRAYETDEQPDSLTTYTTALTLDVVGNPTVVTDALGIDTQTQHFDLLGRPIRTVSPDAGFTVSLLDVAGQPTKVFRAGDLALAHTYDALRRRTHLHVIEGTTTRLKERNIYGETSGVPSTGYFKGRPYRQYDTAGVVTTTAYDFKGNALGTERRFWADVDDEIDWSDLTSTSVGDLETEADPLLESTTYATEVTFDALNRPVTETAPDDSVTTYTYDAGGKLTAVDVNIRGATPATSFVGEIRYNARGQREEVAYGNGVATTYAYEPDTFRLSELRSVRASDSAVLQDLEYTYDPVGNITRIENNAEDTLYFDNAAVTPDSDFVYDALYRLTSGNGRERASAAQPAGDNDFVDYDGSGTPDDSEVARYTEQYTYDAVGNIVEVVHREGTGTGTVVWRRKYRYEGQGTGSTPGTQVSNRLAHTTVPGSTTLWHSYTSDDRGSLTSMPHLDGIETDFRDQMRRAALNSSGDDALYFYDAGGQRVRKVVRTGANVEERRYLGKYELWQKTVSSTLDEERTTLHVMDGERRVALVETKTVDGGTTVSSPTPVSRFQLDNHLGSATLELDEDAAIISYEEYHPYGSTSWWATKSGTGVSQKRYRYTGKEKDEETGLYYHGARCYAPWLGRWSSADPAGMVDGPNLYMYVRGRATNASDTTGNFTLLAYLLTLTAEAPTEPEPPPRTEGDDVVDRVVHQVAQERTGPPKPDARGNVTYLGATPERTFTVPAGEPPPGLATSGEPVAAAVNAPINFVASEILGGAVAAAALTGATKFGRFVGDVASEAASSRRGALGWRPPRGGATGPDEFFDALPSGTGGRTRVPDADIEAAGLFGEGDIEGMRVFRPGGDADPVHHLMTDKNYWSTARGGPWSPRFEELAEKAGMTLKDDLNKVIVPGHGGPHGAEYHQAVFDRLFSATEGLQGDPYAAAFKAELEAIKVEASTSGTFLNTLLTSR